MWRRHVCYVCKRSVCGGDEPQPVAATGGRVFVAGIFIPVGNHYFQALANTLQFVAQVCDRLWLVPASDKAFCGCVSFSNNNFYMSP